MKISLFILSFLFYNAATNAQQGDLAHVSLHNSFGADSSLPVSKKIIPDFSGFDLSHLFQHKVSSKGILGYTKNNKPVDVYFFPGTSNKKALIIGGMHGSELSSIEVAYELIEQLYKSDQPYYNVVIIPSLFPDNAAAAEKGGRKRVENNTGRYSHEHAADPNRQMPILGKPFKENDPIDIKSRIIENENRLLLRLIQSYLPHRIVNLHAIKDISKAGIFADPRTDCNGIAKGFETDSLLAISMAQYIYENGGIVPGNNLTNTPTALYYHDPKIAGAGHLQQRNLKGTNLSHQRGHGVSLGSWAATDVCDEENVHTRPAVRLITVEFPGYKKREEYKTISDQIKHTKLISIYASAIVVFVLREFYVENALENSPSEIISGK